MLRLFASINQQHHLFANAKLFILIIDSDRKIQMISDSQASESATSTLFGTNPEKGRWIFGALGLATNICRGSICSWSVFGRPLRTLVHRCNRQPIAIYLVSNAFRPFVTFSGRPFNQCGPLQIQRICIMKENSGE